MPPPILLRSMPDLRSAQIQSMSSLVDNFAKYARRQEVTRFLARHELFNETK